MKATPIAMRLEEKELDEIESVSKLEHIDRTSTIRKLLALGIKQYLLNNASERYIKGEYSLSRAAREAQSSIFELQEFLAAKGYRHHETRQELAKGIRTSIQALK